MDFTKTNEVRRTARVDICFDDLSREELLVKVKSLQAHNNQLKNVIAKCDIPKSRNHKKGQKLFDFNSCKMRHVLLKMYYLGWNHHGFTVQEDTTNTIEFFLFKALVKTCLIKDRTTSNYHRCARTDKGVSSFGQVISIDLRSISDDVSQELDYCAVLNKVLPPTIQCVAWYPVDDNFSARFDCTSRSYKYYFPKASLDIKSMQEASNNLIGTHDFRNFCKMDVGNGIIKHLRTIVAIDIAPYSINKNEEFSMYVITIQAQAFLWHQIRCIMGILFLIGLHKETPEVIKELLDIEKYPRKPDYNLASEVPLNLFRCHYDFEDEQDWIYNKESLNLVIGKLQSIWAISAAKTSMLENMIHDLQKKQEVHSPDFLINSLLTGVKSKRYIPLSQRKTCESLENRIQHFVKRRKLDIHVPNDDAPNTS